MNRVKKKNINSFMFVDFPRLGIRDGFPNSNWWSCMCVCVRVCVCMCVCVCTLMFELPRGRGNSLQKARGVGAPQGNIIGGCLIEPFYLWYEPHLSGFSEQQQGKQNALSLSLSQREKKREKKKKGFITQCRHQEITSSSLLIVLFSNVKPKEEEEEEEEGV